MKTIYKVVFIIVVYYITGRLGFLVAMPPGNITAIWPPSGLALAMTLLWGKSALLGVWLGSFVLNYWFLVETKTMLAIPASIVIATGSTLQAIAGYFWIRHWIGNANDILRKGVSVFRFNIIVLTVCLIAATIGVFILCLLGWMTWDNYADGWWTWWLGDVTGILVITPLLLTWRYLPSMKRWKKIEAVGLVVLLSIIVAMVFGLYKTDGKLYYPVLLLTIPILLWTTFRFDARGTTIAILFLSVMMIWITANGHGPFVHRHISTSIILVQLFVAIITMQTLAITATITENKDIQNELQEIFKEQNQNFHNV